MLFTRALFYTTQRQILAEWICCGSDFLHLLWKVADMTLGLLTLGEKKAFSLWKLKLYIGNIIKFSKLFIFQFFYLFLVYKTTGFSSGILIPHLRAIQMEWTWGHGPRNKNDNAIWKWLERDSSLNSANSKCSPGNECECVKIWVRFSRAIWWLLLPVSALCLDTKCENMPCKVKAHLVHSPFKIIYFTAVWLWCCSEVGSDSIT